MRTEACWLSANNDSLDYREIAAMKIRLNHPDKDKDGSLDHPTMDPMAKEKYLDEDEHTQEATADYPADVGNDIGQFSEAQNVTYPPFPEVNAEGNTVNAAQQGGAGPRIDDLGIDDLHDIPRDQDLAAIDEFTSDMGDRPLFDRSIENIDVGDTGNDTEAADEDAPAEGSTRLPEKEDQLADEESGVYDVSVDGPGTRDLH